MRRILSQTGIKSIEVQPICYNQTIELVVRSNVNNRQTYDAVTDTFTPDYTISSFVLFPDCRLIDPDSPVASIPVNATLSNFRWYEITGSTQTVIADEAGSKQAKNYEVVTTKGDANRGMLTIKKNSEVGVRRKLRFYAEWIDDTSGYIYRFSRDMYLVLEDVTDATPTLSLDVPNTDKWNPFRQDAERTINALVQVGKFNKTDDAKTKLFWYRVVGTEIRQLINSADDEDNWEIKNVTKSSNGSIVSMVIDRELMGDGVSYEVRCAYRPDGNLPSEPEAGDPIATTNLVRTFPKIEASFVGSNARVWAGNNTVLLKAIVSDNQGPIPNWENVAYAEWYLCTNTANTNADGTKVSVINRELLGKGSEITVTIDQAKRIQLDIVDRGATNAMVDDDSNYLTDNEDAFLVEKPVIV